MDQRIDSLEVALSEVKEQVINLTLATLAEGPEPYAAFEASHHVCGIGATQLRFIIAGVLNRAQGNYEDLHTKLTGDVFGNTHVREAHQPLPVTFPEAAILIGRFLGAEEYQAGRLGCEALDAHWQRGFDDNAHAALRGLPLAD